MMTLKLLVPVFRFCCCCYLAIIFTIAGTVVWAACTSMADCDLTDKNACGLKDVADCASGECKTTRDICDTCECPIVQDACSCATKSHSAN